MCNTWGGSQLKVEVITTGTELLLGEILNTNFTWLAQELNLRGFDVLYQTTVGDNPVRMKEVLDIIRADSTLHQTLEKAGMPINTEGTFWVRETIHSGVLRKRKLQYFDPKTNAVIRSTDPLYPHRRMSIVYF